MVARKDISIAGISAAQFDAFLPLMADGTLTRDAADGTKDDANNLSRGTVGTVTYNFKGMTEKKSRRIPDSMTTEPITVIYILGRSLPVEPELNDMVTIHGETYRLAEFYTETDPVRALWTFIGE